MFVVIAGPSATGKTTIAAMLAERIGGIHLSVDCVVEGLLAAGMDRDLRTAVAAYQAVRVSAEQAVGHNRHVIVDAVSDTDWSRDLWSSTAKNLSTSSALIALHLPDQAEHRRRLVKRSRPFTEIPEISWEQLLKRMESSPTWPEDWMTLDASGPPELVLGRLESLLS